MSVEQLKQAMLAKTADNGKVENNEDSTNKGRANVHPNPSGREPGKLDAQWGDNPPPPVVHGTAVEQGAKDTRNEMIERLFDSPKTTAPAEQALMRSVYENADGAISHSPMLQRGRVAEKQASDETLTDQVVRVAGRR